MISTDGAPMFLRIKHIKKKRGFDKDFYFQVTIRIDRETKIEVTTRGYPRDILYMLLGRMNGRKEFYQRVCNFIMDYLDEAKPQLNECENGNWDVRFPIMREKPMEKGGFDLR